MRVLALSTDSVYAHKVFAETSPSGRQINYPLLSDRTGRVPWLYGALIPDQGVAGRLTVLIDPEGKIAFYLANPEAVGRSTAEILRLIQAEQYHRNTGLVTPANWQPGEPGIQRQFRNVGRY